jgi:hypothetical protein
MTFMLIDFGAADREELDVRQFHRSGSMDGRSTGQHDPTPMKPDTLMRASIHCMANHSAAAHFQIVGFELKPAQDPPHLLGRFLLTLQQADQVGHTGRVGDAGGVLALQRWGRAIVSAPAPDQPGKHRCLRLSNKRWLLNPERSHPFPDGERGRTDFPAHWLRGH